MPTNSSGPVHPMSFSIPVTVTYWVPVFGPTGPTQPSPSQSSSQPQPSQPQQQVFNPFQVMMQAMFNQMMMPTPPNSPRSQQSSQQQPSQQSSQPTNIPLPVLLNMMYAMGQPMTPEMMSYMSNMSPDMLSSFMQGGGNKPPPCTANHVINDMKKYTYGQHSITPSITTCSVCQDDFAEGDQWTALPCQHPYHIDCITPWLKQHHTCPSCRYPLETDDSEYNQRVVIPTQQTRKHTFKPQPEPIISCAMIHHTPCTLLSGNTAQVTLNCHHTFHLECLSTAQRVLCPSTSTHGPQTVTCPICHTHQTFPVQLTHLIQASTPPTTTTTTTTTPSQPSQPPMMSPKDGMTPKDVDIAFDFPTTTTSTTITSSPQQTPIIASESPVMTSLNGTATIEDDVEMSDA